MVVKTRGCEQDRYATKGIKVWGVKQRNLPERASNSYTGEVLVLQKGYFKSVELVPDYKTAPANQGGGKKKTEKTAVATMYQCK